MTRGTGAIRMGIACALLFGSLSMVVWRQSRALEELRGLLEDAHLLGQEQKTALLEALENGTLIPFKRMSPSLVTSTVAPDRDSIARAAEHGLRRSEGAEQPRCRSRRSRFGSARPLPRAHSRPAIPSAGESFISRTRATAVTATTARRARATWSARAALW